MENLSVGGFIGAIIGVLIVGCPQRSSLELHFGRQLVAVIGAVGVHCSLPDDELRVVVAGACGKRAGSGLHHGGPAALQSLEQCEALRRCHVDDGLSADIHLLVGGNHAVA